MGQGSKFATGRLSKAICDRTGAKFDYSELVIEPDTKLFVHRDEVDDPDPYRRLRSRQDAIALRNPRPDTDLEELAASLTGICLAQSAAGAQALTLNGSFVSGGVAILDADGNPKQVIVVSAGNDSALVFTITGTVLPGVPFTETIQGANAGQSGTIEPLYTVTRIAMSGPTASTVTAGTSSTNNFFDTDGE